MGTAAVGHSRADDAFGAGQAAASEAVSRAGGEPVVAIVYATVVYDHARLLAGVRAAVGPDAAIVGCSTQGISRNGAVEEVDRVVGVAVLAGPGIRVRVARVEGLAADPAAAGRALAAALGPLASGGCPPLIWYDPLTGGNIDLLLAGLAEGGLPVVVGGGAGQHWGPIHRTYQFFGDEVLRDSALGLVIDGVRMVCELSHGAEPLGLDLTITEAEGNVLRKIDGQPALQVWAEHLGGGRENNVDDTAAWSLGVQLPAGEAANYEGPITRAVFGFRPDTQEIVLQAPIPTGTTVQLCHRTQQAVHDRALDMAHRVRERLVDTRPLLVLSFECGARPRPFLGDRGAAEEVRAIQEVLGADLPWLGFYAWGELAPIGAHTYFHNYTFPLVALVEV
ncbi:MAG: FIST N-terminal domain-containing protein [Myxococcota bacterium]